MFKRISLLILSILMLFSVTGCQKQVEAKAHDHDHENEQIIIESEAYKIGIVTPTLSTSEDEFRAAASMVEWVLKLQKKI